MLPDSTVPASLLAVLTFLRGCFTTPTFSTFAALVTGLIAQTGRGTVTGMLTGAGLTRPWSHARAHAFFSRASWNPDLLGISLSHLVVRQLMPADAVLTVAVDDTLFKRRGKKVFGAAWQHDGAATGPRGVGRGTCFVVIGLVVDLPFLARPVCLPVMARLWRPKQEVSKVDIAASMVRFLAACHHGRRVHVVADAAYHDRPVPIAHGQVTTQPSLVGQMVAALRLGGGERVLEVGTGLGFQAAILGVLAGGGRVWTVERFADLAERATANLAAAGVANVTVVVGDGTLGWSEGAPYDAVVVAAAAPRVPAPLAAQLAEGGRLVQPLGPGGDELVTLLRKRGGRLVEQGMVVPAHFVRLVGAHGLPEPRG